jgi:transposase
VIKTSKQDEPVLNKSYLEMAEHYGFAVIPARPYRPKDKPTTEKTVNIATTWVLAALRNQVFFNLGDLNAAIADKLEELNDKPFQKLTGSRRSAFLGEEAAALQPLPQTPYELAIWKTATVNLGYCVEVDKSFYSVPYQYINYKVDVRLTTRILEVFYQGQRICSHPRHYGRPGHYETNPEHMPAKHQAHLEWDGDRFRKWADKIGRYTRTVIDQLLTSRTHEQQAYRACMSLLKLSDKYTAIRLEKACERAMSLHYPSYKVVKNILASGQDHISTQDGSSTASKSGKTHRNVRGYDYYAQLAQNMQEKQISLDSLADNKEA